MKLNPDKSYIFDCFGNVQGRKNGYDSIRRLNCAVSKLERKLWAIYDQAKEEKTIPEWQTLIYSSGYAPESKL